MRLFVRSRSTVQVNYSNVSIMILMRLYISPLSSLDAGSGEASPTIWSCYANLRSLSLFISLEIEVYEHRNICMHSMTKSRAGFATGCRSTNKNISTHNQNSKTNNIHKKTNNNLLFIQQVQHEIKCHLTSQSSKSLSNFGSLFTCFSIRNGIVNINLL